MNAATWLFWTLGTISLAWTGGMLILRKADIGEFFAEFARFILFFGFYLWLLRKWPGNCGRHHQLDAPDRRIRNYSVSACRPRGRRCRLHDLEIER